jgi:hypothetical protein
MKRHRHRPEQVVRKLREGDRLLSEGRDLADVLRHLEVSESSWNRWRYQYWIHLRTTNPIESTFATVRHRTKITRGPGSKAAGQPWRSS